MPETCDTLLGLVYNCVHYARDTYGIDKVLAYSVDFKASSELWNPLSTTVLSVILFGM